ncbi:DUF5615 family PIN-like protein [Thiohalorhabdus denitrificans]|uniref:Predicted nuclease, contains PIN domain, potential toxin-antitoxin system component n=1 Tax=Thiohalorhabdus denitrificans TaxID=381306 RepID=A0A1G5HWT2_9GAMM|nr:DUF5615 family PIN-like protein [Thiohalorhabdus denitrificans]SCY68292.1 Predicted nuclease, contains PIN domain, potential toxin-antitoxin system component [Thiohalorhabdus denitrificans]
MRFLVDAQLPPALARWLSEQGHQAEHVVDLGLEASPDREIWRVAHQTGAVVISKDEDFVTLVTLQPEHAQVVWVRLGNTTKRGLLNWFAPLLPQVVHALERGERLVEVKAKGE